MMRGISVPFLVAVSLAVAAGSAGAAGPQNTGGAGGGGSFPILAGDPIDPSTNRAYTILPGVPLILDPGHGDPLVIDQTKIGDVDLVVRAGSPAIGASIPPPAAVPLPTVMAGGTHVADGTTLPFRVFASDGAASPAAGNPLGGAELDGIPAIVFVFADLDGDGFIGPTDADAAGALDNDRELQEVYFPVGRGVAVFQNGVASGSVAIAQGAPPSADGLTVVLTAAAYIGPYDGFMHNNVPDGPPVATLFPFLPKLAPDRVVDGTGAGGRAGPDVRIELILEPSIDPLVGNPTVGTPFAIPTDGSSVSVDRAVVYSAGYSRARFVRPSDAADFAPHPAAPASIRRGDGGALVTALPEVTLASNAPLAVQLVPVDRLDNVTAPASPQTVTVVAGPGVAIVSPDVDADPSREDVALSTAAGAQITLVADGAAGGDASVDVLANRYVVESLTAHLPAVGSTTTTTIAATTTTTGGATTTSTTVVDTTTTTLVGPTTTVADTTTTATDTTTTSTTTTTTLPGCGVAATFPSLGCRLDALRLALLHDLPAGSVLDKSLTALDRARSALADAAAADAAGMRRPTRQQVRTVIHQLGTLRARLRSKQALHAVDGAVLTRLLADVAAITADVKALRDAL